MTDARSALATEELLKERIGRGKREVIDVYGKRGMAAGAVVDAPVRLIVDAPTKRVVHQLIPRVRRTVANERELARDERVVVRNDDARQVRCEAERLEHVWCARHERFAEHVQKPLRR